MTSSSSLPTPGRRLSTVLVLCLIAVLGVLIYSNTFHAKFHFDDTSSILENPAVRDPFDLPRIWKAHGSRALGYWTFALNYYLGYKNVTGYHAFNLAVHVLAALFVFLLIRVTFETPRMRGTMPPWESDLLALTGALMFLAHPVQTQAVTYIVQRLASMTALFYIAAVYFYVKAGLGKKRGYFWGSVACALAATFSKQTAYTLPFMLLLYEFMFMKRPGDRSRNSFLRVAPFFAPLLLVFFAHYVPALGSRGMEGVTRADTDMSRWHYFLTQISVIVTYLRLLLAPVRQSLDYSYPITTTFWNLRTVGCFFLLALLAVLAFRIRKKNRLITFGFCWFLIALSVESSFLPIKDVIFEHRLYLPMAGAVMAALGLMQVVFRNTNRIVILGSVLVIVWGVLAFRRNFVWRDPVALWSDVVRNFPENARAYNNLSNAYFNQDDLDTALKYIQRSLELDPNVAVPHYNYGRILDKKKRHREAIAEFNESLRISGSYAKAMIGLGNAYMSLNSPKDAIEQFKKSVVNPFNEDAYVNLGNAYMQLGEVDNAIQAYSGALASEPRYKEAHSGIGAAYILNGQYDLAREHLEKAVRLDPGYKDAQTNLAVLMDLLGRPVEERAKIIEGLRVTPSDELRDRLTALPGGLSGLPPEYAGAKDFREAPEEVKRAVAAVNQLKGLPRLPKTVKPVDRYKPAGAQ